MTLNKSVGIPPLSSIHKQKENKQTSYVNTIYNTLPNWYRKNNKNNNTVKIFLKHN
jgi:hypothetical protein